ncbi:MAG TPA: type IV toxin-antitoxin system AbiEi family antitoxin domain-containing protein [Chloroflexota bacterium]
MAAARGTDLSGLEALALQQGGYFDRGDALAHGLRDNHLHHHLRTGRFERVFPGVYRVARAPLSPQDQHLRAYVWTNYRGALSHESALAVHDLSDVVPNRTHVTVPGRFHRAGPFVVHLSALPNEDLTWRDGFRVTSPARSIVDAAFDGTDPEQVRRAVQEALERAVATPDQIRSALARSGYRTGRRAVEALVEAALRHAAA